MGGLAGVNGRAARYFAVLVCYNLRFYHLHIIEAFSFFL
jgi:hypothetical protein